MFGQSLLSAFGIACTTDTDQLFATDETTTSTATYQLNNATTSIPSNTYPGTANTITYAAGKFGNAAVFNGSSSYIALPTGEFNYSNFTISSWVYPTSAPTVRGCILSTYMYTAGPSKGYLFGINANMTVHFSSYYDDSGNRVTGDTTQTVPFNQWTQLSLSFSTVDSKIIFYINGVSVKTITFSGNVLRYENNNNTSIGSLKYNSSSIEQYFLGRIDQLRIFDTALPQSAITVLYNETTTTAASASIDYVDANPNSIAYYKMSDATDQLGNYNGTATNVNFNTEGKFGFAGAFNGSSKIDITGFPNFGSTGVSISAWVYVDSFSNGPTIVNLYSNNSIVFGTNSSGNFFRSGQGPTVTSTLAMSTATWHHVVMSAQTNGTVNLYLDGVAAGSGNATTAMYNDNNISDLIGAYGTLSQPMNGRIDQIRIYDSAISAANVSTLYKEVECEPAAINALANFNTVLYTGNGGTQAVTGVGFKPSLSWVKNRNTAGNNNNLADSIRGVNNLIYSNSTNAQYFNSTYQFNSFDTDGITVTDDAAGNYGVNGNNETYVAWNWKAPLANLSTSFNGSSSRIALASTVGRTITQSFSFWFNRSSTPSAREAVIANERASSSDKGFDLTVDTSGQPRLRFFGGSAGNQSTQTASTNICDGSWHHIVISFNLTVSSTDNAFLYIDNSVALDFESIYWTSGNSTEPVNIGAYPTLSADFFEGKIAQLRIFNDILTASEVSDLYAEPAASNNTLNYPAGAGCIAAYPLQTDAVDLSGNYSGASSNVTFGQPGYLTSNTDGTIPSTVAANPEAGFSIVGYTGNGAASATVGHGLAVQPRLVIVKRLLGGYNWMVGYLNNSNSQHSLYLNTTDAKDNELNRSPQAFNTTTFQLGSIANAHTNGSTNEYIAYCFTSIPGYSKIGFYIGNDATNTIYVGFKPRFLLIKCSSNGGTNKDWVIIDSTMDPSTPITKRLEANTSDAEATDTINITMNNNGWTMPNGTSTASINQIGFSYIFLAIA